MAFTSRTLAAPRDAVWEVLVDPTTYTDWLIGADSIRDVDDSWPAVGSRFHHRVGLGLLSLPDHSEVLALDPGRLLRLAVRARPFVSAVATFTLVSDVTATVVSLEEQPRVRSIGNAVRPILDPSIHVRNHRSLRRLAHIVEGGSAVAAVQ
jgi:uncharacterized protein YndB with AHSA1/START domain